VAQAPTSISVQGIAADDGEPLPDGPYTVELRLYTQARGGEPLTEQVASADVRAGRFAVSMDGASVAFDQLYWLGVSFPEVAASELEPRVPLAAVPYSHRAHSLEPSALVAGDNITITPDGEALAIAATAAGFELPFDAEVEANDAPAFRVTNDGSRSAAEFRVDNIDNFNSAILASTNGTGAALFARSFGLGRTALFRNEGFGNTTPAVEAFTAGTDGVAILANHGGSAGDVAIFQSGGTNVARIDKDGVGYFNGGVQSSGADVAELFAVEGAVAHYEPGDVLVISTTTDRTVVTSAEPYSTLVAGVYATKPGLTLTERGIEDDVRDLVHLGVVGVIPTKVTAENGPIRRGDLLVTSSRAGHAMRGTDKDRLPGAVLGKALEVFEGPGSGVIRVLVNVQ
jgi:hypothetical protein